MEKTVLTAQDLLEDSFNLGLQVLESGFEPTMIIAIWRGGTPVGMALQEILAYCGVESDHIAIRTSSYVGVDQRGAVAVHHFLSCFNSFFNGSFKVKRSFW